MSSNHKARPVVQKASAEDNVRDLLLSKIDEVAGMPELNPTRDAAVQTGALTAKQHNMYVCPCSQCLTLRKVLSLFASAGHRMFYSSEPQYERLSVPTQV